MKAVILCGGKGLRMRGDAGFTCKPMVRIGEIPVLQHVMNIYRKHGIHEFILCLGYNGEIIKDYFVNLDWRTHNLRLYLDKDSKRITLLDATAEWDIIFADTGLNTMTGGRIKKIQKFVDDAEFMLTYADGVSDIDLARLLKFHGEKGKIATVTGVHPRSGYGLMKVENGIAAEFQEKPLLEGWVNGGFFVLNRRVFDYIDDSDQCVWEEEPIRRLIADKELAVYEHEGFWFALDTVKDAEAINRMWEKGEKPWT
ncbi:MAG: sugar phosphate nucleotidyltransferase [Bacillota bacterium]